MSRVSLPSTRALLLTVVATLGCAATGHYGAQAGDLVRVDCRTLQPIGLVRR